MSTSPTEDETPVRPLTESEAAVLEHAWNWFSLHSGQRMQLLSFFFVGFGLVVAGYGSALQADLHIVAGVLSVAGLLIAAAFFLADLRTRELVKASEVPLAAIQQRLAETSGVSTINLVNGVEQPKLPHSSYGAIINKLMIATAVLMVLGLAFAVYHGAQPEEEWHLPQHDGHHDYYHGNPPRIPSAPSSSESPSTPAPDQAPTPSRNPKNSR